MKLYEIAKKVPDGSYVAVKYDDESRDKLYEFAEKLNLPNLLPKSKYHTTLIYSRKYNPDIKEDQSLYPLKIKGKELHVFDTQDNKRALVMKFDSPELVERHNFLMSEYQLQYDYDEYIPHITLSYDIGDMDVDFSGKFPIMTVTEEYVEDLIFDWQNKKENKNE